MSEIITTFLKVLPILLIIPLGYLLKQIKLLKKEDTKVLNTLYVKVALPATIFLAFASINLKSNMIFLPIAGLIIVFLLMIIGAAIVSILKPEKTIRDIFMIIMPSLAPATVAYPFFFKLFGEIGTATMALINIGNILFLFSIDRHIAMKYGHKKEKIGIVFKEFIEAPVIWATAAGLIVAAFHTPSTFINDFFRLLSNATIFLIMISLGLGFEWKTNIMKKVFPIILLKTSAGLIVGFFLAMLFKFAGMEQIALIIYAFVPPSAITYVWVTEAKLEKTFEADLLSLALPIGVFLTGLLLIFTEILTSITIIYIAVPVFIIGMIFMKIVNSSSK